MDSQGNDKVLEPVMEVTATEEKTIDELTEISPAKNFNDLAATTANV